MRKKPTNLEELKNLAFKIPEEGLYIRKKGKINGELNTVYVKPFPMVIKCYCIEKDQVTFITKEGEYVIPYFIGIIEILQKEEFMEISFMQAFETGEYPVDKQKAKQWNEVCETVKSFSKQEKKIYACAIAKQKYVRYIPYVIRRNSFELIKEYMVKTNGGGIKKVKPMIDVNKIRRDDYEKIGTYNMSNGMAVIISNEGITYLCKTLDPDFETTMETAGYSKNPALPVPMSNGEKFLDINVQKEFEKAIK